MLQTIEKVGLRWLLRFRKLDMTQPEQRQALVDTFINAIYLYDDKVLITFNYKEGTETVAFGEAVKAEKSSDMSARGAPDIERQIVRFDVLFYVGKRLHTFCTPFAQPAFLCIKRVGFLGLGLLQDERGFATLTPVRERVVDLLGVELFQSVLVGSLHGLIDRDSATPIGCIKVQITRL